MSRKNKPNKVKPGPNPQDEYKNRTVDTPCPPGIYSRIFELSSEVIFITSLQGDIINCNTTAMNTFGFKTRDEIYLRKVFEFYSDPDIRTDVIDQLVSRGMYTYKNTIFLKKDGTPLYCSGTAELYKGMDNKSCIIVILNDITHDLAIESALEESEERYKELVENINDIIYTLDDQGNITYISPVVEQISSYRVSDLMGVNFLNLIHPEDVPGILESYEKTMQGHIDPFEFRIKDGDGSWRYVRTSSRLIKKDGETTGLHAILTDISEKRGVDEKLKFQSMLLNQIQDRITATDLEGRITYINDSELRLFKKTREEIIGSYIFSFGEDPEFGATQQEILDTTLSNGSWNGTVVNYDADGEKKILESRTWLTRDSRGNPTGMVGVSTDVTTQFKTNEVLTSTLEQNRAILHTLQDIIYIFDRHGRCIDILSAHEDLYSHNSELMLGKTLNEILPSEQAGFFLGTISQAIETGETQVVEYEMSGKSGIRYYEGRVATFNYGSDKEVLVAWFAADCTEKWLTKKALVLSEEKYRSLIETINIAIFVTRNGKILYINSYSSIITGYSEEELINRPFTDFIHPNDRDILLERHHMRMKGEKVSNRFPFRIINSNGESRWMEISAITTEWDNLPSVLNFMIDITERILAEEQMKMAKERAEEADSLKSAFLANISHELRTPINAINGSIDLLLEDDSGEYQLEYLNIIKHSNSLLLSLIEDTLDLSKIESGQIEIDRIPFNIRDILLQSDLNVRLMITQNNKDIEYSSSVDDKISEYISGDPVRLQQVISNLTGNAVKFTDSGKIVLRTELTDNKMLSFTVIDTGPGIPPDKKLRIFERFHQVDQSLSRKHSGAGLGLTISKSIIELMNGTISFESRTGNDHGTEFTFTIPYLPAEIQSQAEPEAREQYLRKEMYTILVVEDNSFNLLLTSRILEKEGYRVITAINGIEALSIFTSGNPVDLVLMDIQMPGMNGFEATEAIKNFEISSGKSSHVPVVALTAHAVKGDRETILESGFDGYIAKPIDRAGLLETLSSFLIPLYSQDQQN